MMKTWVVAIGLLTFSVGLASAGKKKNKCLQLISGTYSETNGPTRKIGTIYEFDIKTVCGNIKIDSVWFGSTPVPCDVIQLNTRSKVDSCLTPSLYRIRANKDLYKHFTRQYDSTTIYKNFVAPMPFQGEAIIFYIINGQRKYYVAKGLTAKAAKPYRHQ